MPALRNIPASMARHAWTRRQVDQKRRRIDERTASPAALFRVFNELLDLELEVSSYHACSNSISK